MLKRRNFLIIFLVLMFVTAGALVPVLQQVTASGDDNDGDGIPDQNAVMATEICAGAPIPAGWVVVNVYTSYATCPQPQPLPNNNIWSIENTNVLYNGSVLDICKGIPNTNSIPAGWSVINEWQQNGRCGINIPTQPNVQTIRRLSGLPTPTPTATPVPNQTPMGNFDYIHDGTALGWALDPDTPSTNVTLHVYIDGPAGTGTGLTGGLKTYFPRPDIVATTGHQGNHGFSYAIPRQFYDGQNHTLYIYIIDTRTGAPPRLLPGSPKMFNLISGSPLGKFDSVGQDRIARGWTLDPSNPNASNSVHFYIDGVAGQGTQIGAAYAGGARPDVNQQTGYPGNHGFEFAIPTQYQDGQNHVLYAYGLDLNGNPNILLDGSPKVFNFPVPPNESRTAFDYNGDGKADQTTIRGNVWNHNLSPNNTHLGGTFGYTTDKFVPADYDGDGKTDSAIFRDVNGVGTWWVIQSSNNTAYSTTFGYGSDTPVPADYDGDKKADLAILRVVNNVYVWWILNSSNNQGYPITLGAPGDRPVPADYDGDRKTDIAVARPNGSGQLSWFIQRSTDGFYGIGFGLNADVVVPGDYDGDGKADPASFRNGQWHIMGSSSGYFIGNNGLAGDIPVPGDYDGDGKTDIAIFRNVNGTGVWWTIKSSDGQNYTLNFGLGTDLPLNGRTP